MKVLVAGANGHTGRLLVQNLDAAGHEAYAMVRKEEQKEDMEGLGGIPVLADLESDLGHAVKGMDAVIFAAGSGSSTPPEKTKDVDRDGAINLIKETEKLGRAPKFIMLSAMKADNPEEGPDKLKYYLEMKGEADEYLRNSELDYTIVRPGALTHEEGTSKIKVGKSVDRGSISRSDVAKTMIAALEEPNAYRKTFEMVEGDTQIEDALKSLE
ncbi:SDR family oxidoreductase [Thalassobacillus devorans]|uniref:SDR family oxidoreductase n=1 Tax=Thalassobacillus devorans TaxID=279813 RepID=UPI000490307C|nr:SDR family oxidoreductase [Thalassobacillus devorans]